MNQPYQFTEDGLWHQSTDGCVRIGVAKQLFHLLFPPSRCSDSSYTIHDALIHLINLELPLIGNDYRKGDELGNLEAEKAIVSFACPVNGIVTKLNELPNNLGELYCEPSLDTWLIELET